MFTSNSYLAPDAGKRRQKSAIVDLWRAESYMKIRKVKDDTEMINWFLRGSPDYVIAWYLRRNHTINKWIDFKINYVVEFGSDWDKSELIFDTNQNDMHVGEYTRKMLQIVASMENGDRTTVHNIVSGMNEDIRNKIKKQMWKRPKSMPHGIWLEKIVERNERKQKANNNNEDKKQNVDRVLGDIECYRNSIGRKIGNEITEEANKKNSVEQQSLLENEAKGKDELQAGNRYNGQSYMERKANSRKLEDSSEMQQKCIGHEENDHVEKEKNEIKELRKLMDEFPAATNNEIKYREPCTLGKCAIKTQVGKRVSVPGKRRVENSIIERTKEQLRKLEEAKIIRKSSSTWRSPVRPVEKSDGSIRICTNLIALNDIVEKEDYPTPLMNDLIEKLQGSEWFTVVDLKDGYFQIEINEEDKEKTAFKFENLLYEWNRMPMGFKNAPSIFQKMMDELLGDLSGKGVEVYLDDIVIHAKSKKDHDMIVREVFKRLEESNLYVNVKKLQLAQKEIKLLGIMVDGKTQKLLGESKNDIMEYPRPVDTKSLRRFLGKMNFYAPFIKDMSKIAIPLYEKTGKYAKFEWSSEMENSFKMLKDNLSNAVGLYLPDYKKKFTLETDASDTGLGATLLQEDASGRMVPIRWASRKLTKAEKNYAITEKELLAVVWGIEYYEYQLKGRRFSLITDHIALESIKKKSEFGNKRMARWIERIQEYDFDITYKKGETVVSADALSRLYENEKEMDDEKTKIVRETHERLLHRGYASIKYEIEKHYKWKGIKEMAEHVIKTCEICNKNNRKQSGGCIFVETKQPLEKTAIDIMKLSEYDTNILVFIDYYTRIAKIRILKDRTSGEIITQLKAVFKELGTPREINSDNAKEFVSSEFAEFCAEYNISHHYTSVENHKANGRVERLIRTIRDALVKIKETEYTLEERVNVIEKSYNNLYHRAIEMTPQEAMDNEKEVQEKNSIAGSYAKAFKNTKKEVFDRGQQVRIASKENLKIKGKLFDRFQTRGVIINEAGNNSYLVKDEEGKIYKVGHADLKGIIESERNNNLKSM
ncbi:hypothetical protein ENBRE01_2758 [Enteropsectra breve]|nr:hypothetical protein ENBRE01_2758 [Enteropsectra breve]